MSVELRARTVAKQQAERSDDDGFSRARFAGQDIEARSQRQRHLIDDREISDAQLGQHDYGWSDSGSPPQPSFTRMRSKNVVPGNRTIRTGLSAFLTLSFSPLTKLVPT